MHRVERAQAAHREKNHDTMARLRAAHLGLPPPEPKTEGMEVEASDETEGTEQALLIRATRNVSAGEMLFMRYNTVDHYDFVKVEKMKQRSKKTS